MLYDNTSMKILREIHFFFPTRGHKCDGCNLGQDYDSNGYRCVRCSLFFHKECTDSDLEIYNVNHPQHSLHIKVVAENEDFHGECKLCRGNLPKMYYYCSICDFAIDLICLKKEVVSSFDNPHIHEHILSLVPKMTKFICHLCGMLDDRFPYVCNLCDLSFHKDCAESALEITYSCHPKHPLKLLTRVPDYTKGKCCLCAKKIHNVFYYCSVCNFSVDVNCAKNPPPFSIVNFKAHEHQLILMPQRNFVCNACGMDDDQNPYVCLQCNFMIHRKCIEMPRIIKINHHVHPIFHNHSLNARYWECEVCHKEISWTCGAYSCLTCPNLAIHLRCATSPRIWDGIELEKISPDTLEVKSFEVIGEGVIKHFGHEKHALRLKEDSDVDDESMRCYICAYPIFHGPFYGCMECNAFIIHQKCAYLPKEKQDPFYKKPITLIQGETLGNSYFFLCIICQYFSEGFYYENTDNSITLDVRCGSIPEALIHECHHHPLYIDSSGEKLCKACGDKVTIALSCVECEYFLDIKCSILPKMVKHKYDKDHFLFLCYGVNMREQLYSCEICEEELNQEKWYYSCNYCAITFHVKCTLGECIWTTPRARPEVITSPNVIQEVANDRLSRPVCDNCNSRCPFPSILKSYYPPIEKTFCSYQCSYMSLDIKGKIIG